MKRNIVSRSSSKTLFRREGREGEGRADNFLPDSSDPISSNLFLSRRRGINSILLFFRFLPFFPFDTLMNIKYLTKTSECVEFLYSDIRTLSIQQFFLFFFSSFQFRHFISRDVLFHVKNHRLLIIDLLGFSNYVYDFILFFKISND